MEREKSEFTAEEHLWAQRSIELRAYKRWRDCGGSGAGALKNWLEAEEEVLTEFCRGAAKKRRIEAK